MSALGSITESASGHRVDLYALQRLTWEILPERKRLTACCQMRARNADSISIQRVHSDYGSSVDFGGVVACGSGWTCPKCAPKIARERGREITTALRQHQENGGQVLFVTLTFPHGREDVLQDQVAGITASRRRTRSGRWWKDIRDDLSMVGYISALEFTHSERNGWHPHLHELWLIGEGVSLEGVKRRIYDKWRAACLAEGLGEPSFEHGVDIRLVADDVEALARYPLFGSDLDRAARELTSSHTKVGRRSDSRTPWDLLLAASGGDQRARMLWREFARTVKGRASLVWSRGLKAAFGIGEASDEEVLDAAIEEEQREADHIADINGEDWANVCKFRARSNLLRWADAFGSVGVELVTSLLAELEADWYRLYGSIRQGCPMPADIEPERARRLLGRFSHRLAA